jgi:ketosteroid isomerase-like protein
VPADKPSPSSAAFYEQLGQNLRTLSLSPRHKYYSDDARVVEHLCTCAIIGQFAGIDGAGRQVAFRLLQIFEFQDGKISRENVWMDTAALTAQLTVPDTAVAH